jgi:Zn-dependent M28 family amino/carboxypeptidase
MEGRGFGTAGNEKARQFIANTFSEAGIAPVFSDGYSQPFSQTYSGRRRQRMFPVADPGSDYSNVPDTTLYGANIVAQIKGQSDKVIIITAHLDHLGIRDGKIYNGADDDASGTSALFAIAKYFNLSQPRHTLLFAALDGEEVGSPGCKYLVDKFPIPLEKVILNVNMDMIAHNERSELYASGLHHYPDLKVPLESIESPIHLLFGHDKPDDPKLDDWTNSSDHRVFHEKNIPFIYFGVEDHKDYHQATDTFENINPEFYVEAVKLIIQAIEGYDISLD